MLPSGSCSTTFPLMTLPLRRYTVSLVRYAARLQQMNSKNNKEYIPFIT